jgi:hypothetical protein
MLRDRRGRQPGFLPIRLSTANDFIEVLLLSPVPTTTSRVEFYIRVTTMSRRS